MHNKKSRHLLLSLGLTMTLSMTFICPQALAISKLSSCASFLKRFSDSVWHEVVNGASNFSNLLPTRVRPTILQPDFMAKHLWAKSNEHTPSREVALLEFVGDNSLTLAESKLIVGTRRNVPKQLYMQELEQMAVNKEMSGVRLLRFRHTHPRTLLNSGKDFSEGDVVAFMELLSDLRADIRFSAVEAVEFEIVYQKSANLNDISRKIFRVSLN